jgi:hypothetical protein
MSLVLQSSGGGSVTLAEPTTASNFTQDLPAASGTVVITGTTPTLNGITFPATQSASADANTLDDYEEGTWTPVVFGRTSAGTGTYTRQLGTYTKIGNVVSIFCNIVWTAHTGTGDLAISGLPFTTDATLGHNTPFSITASNVTFSNQLVSSVDRNATTFGLFQMSSGAALLEVAMDVSGTINIAGVYKVA